LDKVTDLFGDVTPQLEERRSKYQEERFWQLNSLNIQHSQVTWQYLMTVNGGGAVAMLAFIGAVGDIRTSVWPYWALAFFMVGLVFVGFAMAHIVHKVQNLQDSWKQDVISYYGRKITWAELLRRDQERVDSWSWLPWCLGWGSFLIFVFGIIFTAWKLAYLTS